MKYAAPDMEVVVVGITAAVATDSEHEVDFNMGDFLSKNSMPK